MGASKKVATIIESSPEAVFDKLPSVSPVNFPVEPISKLPKAVLSTINPTISTLSSQPSMNDEVYWKNKYMKLKENFDQLSNFISTKQGVEMQSLIESKKKLVKAAEKHIETMKSELDSEKQNSQTIIKTLSQLCGLSVDIIPDRPGCYICQYQLPSDEIDFVFELNFVGEDVEYTPVSMNEKI